MRHHCGLFFASALQCHLLGTRFLPTVGHNRNGSIHGRPRHGQMKRCKRTTRTQVQFHSQASSVSAQRRTQMKAAPVLQPRVRRRWQIGKVPGRKSTEHVCSWLSMQLTMGATTIYLDTERMHLKFQASSVSAQRRTPMKAAPVLQPQVRQRWQIGKVPGRKSAQHICHSLSMQLWTQLQYI